MLALGVGALPEGAGLQPLFDHVGAPAFGTFLGDGFAPGDEIALGPADAAVKRLAALRAPLGDFALVALRAFHADGLLLDVFAGGVIAACGELAEAAGLEHHVVAALRADFVQLLVGLLLRAANRLGGFAVRVAGASEEGAEAALLEHHGPAAILAVLFVALLGKIGLVDIRQIHRQLARVCAIRIAGAGNEAAVFAPLDYQRLAALLANQVGGLLHPLDIRHVLFGVLQVLVEALIELLHGDAPVDLPVLDLVELGLHARRIRDVEDVVEAFEQQVGDHHAEFGGSEAAAILLDVIALLNGGNDRGVRGRASDAVGFQALHQRGFVIARRWLGEVLFRTDGLEPQAL